MENKSEEEIYDVVVVGAGLMGSSAAYSASSANTPKRVLLLEQFELLHGKGSSHGPSRIFRVAYPDPVYTSLCIDSLERWHHIEKAAGVSLIEMTGELDFASENKQDIEKVQRTLEQQNIPCEVLSGPQANAKFPGFSLGDSSLAVFNPMAGILNPTLAMQTLQTLAKQQGVTIRDRSEVKEIYAEDREGETVVVIVLADGTSVVTRECIVTAGPWTKKLIGSSAAASVNIQPIATFGTYWKSSAPSKDELYLSDKFPVFISYDHPEVYGLAMQDPSVGVKICTHYGPNVDPVERASATQPAEDMKFLKAFIDQNFSSVDATEPSKVDHCMYSMTPDSDFILDFLPFPCRGQPNKVKNVVIGAGFSGHGAKMTPVIGQILADLALDKKTKYQIDKFRLNRGATALSS